MWTPTARREAIRLRVNPATPARRQVAPGFLSLAALPALLAISGLLALPSPFRAEDQVVARSIGLLYADARLARTVERAIALWRPCCDGATMPNLLDNRAGERVLYLSLRKHSGDQRCGTFAGQRVVLYMTARDRAGRIVRCGDPALNLAHEIGHAIGLSDLTEPRADRQHIMAPIHHANAFRREIGQFECGMAIAARTRAIERVLGAPAAGVLGGAVAPARSLP